MEKHFPGRTVTRRQVLKSAVVAAGAGLLAACSTPAPAPTTAPKPAATTAPAPAATSSAPLVTTAVPAAQAAQPTTAPTAQMTSMHAPEANVKKGGVLRVAGPATIAHYDFYSGVGWPMNVWPMYNGLVRLNLNDGLKTIIPDLAEKWDIQQAGKVYVFTLRDGVKFHDGTVLSSDDVVTTFNKILNPPQGIISNFRDWVSYIDKVEAVDKLNVRFTLKEPRAYFLEILTGGSCQNHGFPILSKEADRV